MLGVVFLGDRKLALREFPDPTPGPRDVVLEIKASGMCGSDLHVYRASFKPGDTTSGFARGAEPVIAGHEPCGVVVAVGSGVSGKEGARRPARDGPSLHPAAAPASTAAPAGRRCA
jgi:D-arabinose 1-dehydrogenase-like Zn-dependent alcohol dehydrogenase